MGPGEEKVRGGSSVKFHTSVLLQNVLSYLDPHPGKRYIDGTIGGGGHSSALLTRGATVLGIDQDPDALEYIAKNMPMDLQKNLKLVLGNFSNISKIANEAGFDQVDGILLDLGVSSHQMDEPLRGFSLNREGPLDMRMDPKLNLNAYDLINNFEKRRLHEVIAAYGEEKLAGPIASAISSARQVAPIRTTTQLSKIIENVYTRCRVSKSRIHPATRTFQALRIVINSELLNLEECLPQTTEILKNGGRLVVISFHSLEDGIVKRFLKGNERFKTLTERPIGPSYAEIEENPRARSAKLRAAEKI